MQFFPSRYNFSHFGTKNPKKFCLFKLFFAQVKKYVTFAHLKSIFKANFCFESLHLPLKIATVIDFRNELD